MTQNLSYFGIDFAGHLYICDSEGQKSNAYIYLWMCASTHAVHLEVTCDFSAITFYCLLDIFVVGEAYRKSFF